ncbi:Syntaxin-31 [Acorus gramineus]|uniref:Syntaxin-31 n=1 Tax=Acorus gramineus TaxID=55184 RepID=A0AAV9B359_ACOGR|nr:Syntaxin-31 [Acorus gramineus]
MASVSSYRDRTAEFRSVSERLKRSVGGGPAAGDEAVDGGGTGTSPATDAAAAAVAARSEFNKKASRIGLGIHQISQKIGRLSKLAKRSSIFDDPVMEIQELTMLIKNEISAINLALSELQVLQTTEVDLGNCSNDRVVHATTICDDLKSRLMGTTKQFKDVLTTRTENLKAHENRKQIFSTNVSRENPSSSHPKTVTKPPPWSNVSNASDNLPSSVMPPSGGQNLNQLRIFGLMITVFLKHCQARRRTASDSTSSHSMEVSMLQQVVPRQENYMQSRAVALQNVESTISELGGIFTQLATMVAQQGEIAIRIDDNMDESLMNVENARSALLQNLNRISSNRAAVFSFFSVKGRLICQVTLTRGPHELRKNYSFFKRDNDLPPPSADK